MIIKKSVNYAIAYALWFVTILLGLWFALLARTDFQGAMTTFYIRGSIIYLERARFFEEFCLSDGFAMVSPCGDHGVVL